MNTSQSQSRRYLVEDKNLSLDSRFTITDDSGNVRYKCSSRFLPVRNKLLLADEFGNELIRIRQENLHFHLTYKLFSVSSNGTENEIASVKRTGPLWQHKLDINSIYGSYALAKKQGVSSNEYILTKDGNPVVGIAKDASPTKNFYWVTVIDDTEDHTFLLAIVIILASAQRLPGNPIAISRSDQS